MKEESCYTSFESNNSFLSRSHHVYYGCLFLTYFYKGMSPLDYAAEREHSETVKTLIENCGALQHVDDGNYDIY